MKYWNKDKDIRKKNWTRVELKPQIMWAHEISSKTKWCKQQSSTGRFYHYYNTWWFERAQDAVLFTLRWSS